jgi:LPXTG-motif cell wall-anchored protein
MLTLGVATFLALVPTAAAQQRTVTVTLSQQSASGVTGTVTLTDIGNSQTRVEVHITPTTGDHPAHIHMGSCANLDPTPEFPLTNVQNGTSTTVVNQALATIQGQQRAVNLHMSATDLATYIACGDIPLVGTQSPNAAPAAVAAPAPAPQTNVGGGQAVAPATVGAAPAQVPVALPRTGDLPNAAPLFVVAGLALAAAGLGLRRRFSRR